MSKLPVWARKPIHKKTVIATKRGWVVEETGEILRVVSDLPEKLEALVAEAKEIENLISRQDVERSEKLSDSDENKVVPRHSKEEKTEETVTTESDSKEEKTEEVKEEQKTEKKKPGPKRRGRPRKNQTN